MPGAATSAGRTRRTASRRRLRRPLGSALYSPVFKIGASGRPCRSITSTVRLLRQLAGRRRTGRLPRQRGVWRKLTTLPYDGPLIWNTYCNPLCNGGGEIGDPCYARARVRASGLQPARPGGGELENGLRRAVGTVSGDLVQFAGGSARCAAHLRHLDGGGYGLDNVTLTSVVQKTCDATPRATWAAGGLRPLRNLTQLCATATRLSSDERWSVDVTLRNSTAAPGEHRGRPAAERQLAQPVSVTGNPGSFGTLAAAAGWRPHLRVRRRADAACIVDVLFDVRNIATSQASYPANRRLLAPVEHRSQQTATQSVSRWSRGLLASSPLLPALTVPVPPTVRR